MPTVPRDRPLGRSARAPRTSRLWKIAMNPNVLVVGGAGYIGGGTTEALLARGIPFTVYDNLTYENHYLKPVNFVFGDVRDHDHLKRLLARHTHVIWLPALVGDGACAINPPLTKVINQNSVEWLAANFDGRILFTSTCSVYGASDQPVTETSPTGPLSVYAQTKLAAESFLRDKNALIFRLGTAFGISDTYSRIRMDLAVNYMTMNAVRKGKLTVFGGAQWRPFVHVNDIGQLLVDNLDKQHRGIYNIATENITILDLATRIHETTECEIEKTDQKFQDNRNYHADVSKALRDGILATSTPRTIAHGIQQIVRLVNENRVADLEHELYSNERRMVAIMDRYANHVSP